MDAGDDTLGARLGRALAHAGFNQKEAEAAAGLSRGYLSRVLRGERTRVEATRLQALAEACGVDFRWLSMGQGAMLSPADAPSRPPPSIAPVVSAAPRVPEENAFEAALGEAFRAGRFALADLDVVRALLPDAALRLGRETSLVQPALRWLDAARSLRRDGRPVTVETFALALARSTVTLSVT
jgi:transcriptional regulator with XRE-family HTH domain